MFDLEQVIRERHSTRLFLPQPVPRALVEEALVTPRLFSPFEESLLLDLKFGITNIVERATARADELTDDELRAGGQRLQAKVKRWRPTVVAFVGIGPYRIVSGIKDARVGLQKVPFGGSHAWVLPNPSGLNAHYQPAALAQLFGDLRLWAIAQHGRR